MKNCSLTAQTQAHCKYCSWSILSHHKLQTVVSKAQKRCLRSRVAAQGFYSASHCLWGLASAQWRIILPQDILFYSKLWGFPGKLTLTPCSCEVTLLASDWSIASILSSHWLREITGCAGESTSEKSWGCVDQCEDNLSEFLFFLLSKYGNVTVASD